MKQIKVLKVHLSAPSGHFRIIDSNNPQRTYPLPPYSTVIGLLANILGKEKLIDEMLSRSFSLGIASRYDNVSLEYTWLRNISKSSHIGRFLLPENRSYNGLREHIGGLMPTNIEVLNDVNLYIYINHPNKKILNALMENASLPERWISHIHLGRSEDWACIETINFQPLPVSNKPKDFCNAPQYFQWLPRQESALGSDSYLSAGQYESLYNKMQGNIILVTSLYKLVKVPYSERCIRNFVCIPARLTNNPVPFLDDLTLPGLFVDKELNIPVYMAQISKGGIYDE